ncbi:MAG TPA: hypothetical protein VMO26_14465 [Vicinamibacterales bacterium]|nr:hypothetical protein [Vicinamibacterales bacterium]
MTIEAAISTVVSADSWDARISAIRLIPEQFGTKDHQAVYSAIAKRVYVPNLAPDFAYVYWRDDYELQPIDDAYAQAKSVTAGFTLVSVEDLKRVITDHARTLRVFRLLIGFTSQEFAAATALVTDSGKPMGTARVRAMEQGVSPTESAALACARVIDGTMTGQLFGPSPIGDMRPKTHKPDTLHGWQTVRHYATEGVPLPVLLHQRHYGGAFRQLLDATSAKRGDVLEDAVEEVFDHHLIERVRTGGHNQEEIAKRFGITVRPAPDFVIFDESGSLRAMLECKAANDGGTARDKASRFRALRQEATRLGGVPLFAVLAGLGWTRTADALGPVIRDTDGRTFTVPTLMEMMQVFPFSSIVV